MPVNLREKTIPSSATLLTLALVTLWSTRPARAQNNCMSLTSSKACPAFDQYYIGLGLADRYSYLAGTTDVESFDQSLFAYVNSTGDYLLPLGCSKDSGKVSYARYSLSRLCAGLIQDASDSLPCNFQHNLTPPPLCQTTCDAWISSVTMITNDTQVCVDSGQRSSAIADLESQCSSWQGYNGTDANACVSGSVNEPGNCGFQNDVASACQFCSSSSDSCCQSVSCKSGLSIGAIVGIAVGSVVGVVLLAFALFCLCSRRKRLRNDHFKFTTYVAPQDDYLHHRRGSGGRTSTVPLTNSDPLQNEHSDHTEPLHNDPTEPLPSHHNEPLHNHHNEPPSSSSGDITPPTPAPPPAPPRALQQPRPEDLYIVVHPYPPQMGDELGLHVGDIIYVAYPFDDGWALGINAMTGLKGAFPMVCVSTVPKDVLDGMMASLQDDDSSKILIEDDEQPQQPYNGNPFVDTPGYNHHHEAQPPRLQLLTVDRIKESVRRSMSLGAFTHSALPRSEMTNHSNIPKRTASMRTTSYGYSEAESPTSPTLNTPLFFDVSTLSNTVVQPRFENHHQDTYELHEHQHSNNNSSGDHLQWNIRSQG